MVGKKSHRVVSRLSHGRKSKETTRRRAKRGSSDLGGRRVSILKMISHLEQTFHNTTKRQPYDRIALPLVVSPLHRYLFTHPHQPVLWLEPLLTSLIVVDQTETSRPSTTELGPETEDGDPVLLGLVHLGEVLADLGSRDGGSGWVEDIQNELFTVEESV